MVMLRYDRYKLVVHICRPISNQKSQELGSQAGMIQSETIMHSLPTRGHWHVDFKTKTVSTFDKGPFWWMFMESSYVKKNKETNQSL